MKLNYIFFAFALFSIEMVLAESKKLTCGKQVAERVEAISDETIHGTWEGKTAPHFHTNGFSISADFLYWKADEDGLDYVQKVNLSQSAEFGTPEDPLLGFPKEPDFQWNPGFRVGIGGQSSHFDDWDIYLGYTYMRNTAHGEISTHSPTTILRPTWDTFGLGGIANRAEAHWNLNYNVWDLELGKDYFVGTRLTVRPYLGLRGAIIRQSYHSKYRIAPDQLIPPIPNSKFNASSHYWGIGVSGGGDMVWHFNRNWGIYGQLSGALLYGSFTLKESLVGAIRGNNGPAILAYRAKEVIWRTRGMIQAAIGLEWESLFNRNRNRVALSLGYEFNTWFQFNQMMKPDTDFATNQNGAIAWRLEPNNGNLSLQGGVFRVAFDF